jgi:hypothetical protein
MLRPRIILANTIYFAFLVYYGVVYLPLLPTTPAVLVFFILGLGFFCYLPLKIYWGLGKAIDGNSQWTDRKTLEFGPFGVTTTGPDWRNENAWTRFKGFFEDADYFYLRVTNEKWVVAIIPKSAFTEEEEDAFRDYASRII